jgi:hypothetical protein
VFIFPYPPAQKVSPFKESPAPPRLLGENIYSFPSAH